MKDLNSMELEIVQGGRRPPGQLGHEGQPGNQGSNHGGHTGYEGQPGNQSNN